MRVVIVGGGFGGVRAALNLTNKPGFEVKLITPNSYFEYHAALYRSATGRSPLEVTIPLKEFFGFAKNVEVIEDSVANLDAQNKSVSGVGGSVYPYEELILALGNVTEYYGIKGLKDYALGVKTIHEALRLKRHLHEDLTSAQAERRYVVIGAGATGVELAAELTAYLKKLRRKHRINQGFSVELIEAAPRAVAGLPENFSKTIDRRLTSLGVKTHYNSAVKSETVDGIQLPSGEIKSHTVVWTAGVTNNPFFGNYPDIFHLGKNKRVSVNEFLSAAPHIYVIGDSTDTEYSGMAQTALSHANFVTDSLIRYQKGQGVRPYAPHRPIYAIPVGPRWAAVLWGKRCIPGKAGWVLRRLADLRLYLRFLTPRKALTTWRYGFEDQEICPICRQ